MTESLLPNVTQFILPFSVLSEKRKETFTEEMEKASIFCFSELERGKGGGLILKQQPEKTVFITEALYPFWAIPWHESTLIFDGLNLTRRTFTYQIFPDVKAFRENMERSSKTFENYMDFLSDNISYFQIPENQKQTLLNGLITNPKLHNEFAMYLQEAIKVEPPILGMTTLPSAIDETAISTMIQELEHIKQEFQDEINKLYENMKALSKTTNNFAKTIRANIRAAQEEFTEKIRKVENTLTPEVNRIQAEYDDQITTLTRNFERQLIPVQKEKIKLEKTVEQKQHRIERHKEDARRHATDGDKIAERKLKEAAKQLQKERSEIQARSKELQAKLKEIEDNKSAETLRLRSEKETKISEAKKDLLDLESSRDAKIETSNEEMEKLKELTSTIITKIKNAAKVRESNLTEIEKFGLRQKWAEPSLIHLPFYLVCYQAESKKRYGVFPPSVVNSVGLSTRLKGALGRAKIRKALSSRFKDISGFLNEFPLIIERDAVLQRETDESGIETNLVNASAKEQIRKGLKDLNDEGWFSEKEYEVFSQALA